MIKILVLALLHMSYFKTRRRPFTNGIHECVLFCLNNIYYNIFSKSKKSSSRELMFTMHITRDDRTKHTQRNKR